jgi:hypothetical protein
MPEVSQDSPHRVKKNVYLLMYRLITRLSNGQPTPRRATSRASRASRGSRGDVFRPAWNRSVCCYVSSGNRHEVPMISRLLRQRVAKPVSPHARCLLAHEIAARL